MTNAQANGQSTNNTTQTTQTNPTNQPSTVSQIANKIGSNIPWALWQPKIASKLFGVFGSEKGQGSSCSVISTNFSIGLCLLEIIFIGIEYIFMAINFILGLLLWLASWVLNFVIFFTVFEFRDNFSELKLGGVGTLLVGQAGSGLIYYLWGIIRDALNIIIFIVIIYHAVRSMFDGFLETRNKFIALLVFSILVNFSLLFVKIGIDISNILTLTAYNLAVKPVNGLGTNWFNRPVAFGSGQPQDLSEFIMNSVNFSEIKAGSADKISEDKKDSSYYYNFIFEIGKALMYIGVIYLLFYISAILVIRALNFLFAMVLSPLLAVDLYFDTFGKSSPPIQELLGGVRTITDKIRDDFFDGLIKGPLLLFFIFIIGVFASSIFKPELTNQIGQALNADPSASGIHPIIKNIIGTWFKFAIFFAMCYVVFTKINAINFGTLGGKNYKGGILSKWANQLVGRGFGGVGRLGALAGQNIIGRGVNRTGLSESFSRMYNNATNKINAKDSSVLSRFLNRRVQNFASVGKKSTDYLKKASYDAGSLSLAKSAQNALGTNFGTAYAEGFDARTKAAKEARQKSDSEREKNIEEGIKADPTKILEKKVGFAGKDVSLKELKDALSEVEKDKSKYSELANAGKGAKINGYDFSGAQLKKLLDEDPLTGGKATYGQEYAAEKKNVEKKAKEDFIKAQERSRALGVSNKPLSSYITPTGIDVNKKIETEARASVYTSEKAKAAAKGKKQKQFGSKFDVLVDTAGELEEGIRRARYAKTLLPSNNKDGQAALDSQINKLKAARIEIQKYLNARPNEKGEFSDDSQKVIDSLVENSSVFEQIIRTKENAARVTHDQIMSGKVLTEDLDIAKENLEKLQKGVTKKQIQDWENQIARLSGGKPFEELEPALKIKVSELESNINSAGAGVDASEIAAAKAKLKEAQAKNGEFRSMLEESQSQRTSNNLVRRFSSSFGAKVEGAGKDQASSKKTEENKKDEKH